MLRAHVPEATVHEDGYSPLGEDDIWSNPAPCCLDRKVFSEAIPGSVQRGPKCYLGARIRAPVSLHHGCHGRRSWVRVVGHLSSRRARVQKLVLLRPGRITGNVHIAERSYDCLRDLLGELWGNRVADLAILSALAASEVHAPREGLYRRRFLNCQPTEMIWDPRDWVAAVPEMLVIVNHLRLATSLKLMLVDDRRAVATHRSWQSQGWSLEVQRAFAVHRKGHLRSVIASRQMGGSRPQDSSR